MGVARWNCGGCHESATGWRQVYKPVYSLLVTRRRLRQPPPRVGIFSGIVNLLFSFLLR